MASLRGMIIYLVVEQWCYYTLGHDANDYDIVEGGRVLAGG